MALLQAIRVSADRLIPADATMRISINNAITFFFYFLEENYPHREKIPFESIKNVHEGIPRAETTSCYGSLLAARKENLIFYDLTVSLK